MMRVRASANLRSFGDCATSCHLVFRRAAFGPQRQLSATSPEFIEAQSITHDQSCGLLCIYSMDVYYLQYVLYRLNSCINCLVKERV